MRKFSALEQISLAWRYATGYRSVERFRLQGQESIKAYQFKKIQALVKHAYANTSFYRRKYDAAKTLAAFSERVRDEVELDRLVGRLVEVVDETMQPAHISLWLRDPGHLPGSVIPGGSPR